jgi:hypothetical protein
MSRINRMSTSWGGAGIGSHGVACSTSVRNACCLDVVAPLGENAVNTIVEIRYDDLRQGLMINGALVLVFHDLHSRDP